MNELSALSLVVLVAASACRCPEPAHAQAPPPYTPPPAAGPAASSGGAPPPAAAASTQQPVNDEERWFYEHYGQAAAVDVLEGKAVYYGDSLSGNHTANGEIYDPRRFTAAHKKLPFNTVVRVVRVDTGRYTYVRITDRGPFGDADRIIDLARIAAEQLDMIRAGVVPVRVEILRYGDGGRWR